MADSVAVALPPEHGLATRLAPFWDIPVVLLLLAATAWLDLTYIRLDQYPPGGDEPIHMLNAMRMGSAYPAQNSNVFNTSYPPLTYLVTHALFAIGGVSLTTAKASMGMFHLVFIASLAWLGRASGGPRGSVLLAVAAAGAPYPSHYTHRYLIDLSLAATFALAFAALVASDTYRRPFPCVVLGLGMGLGMLSKWSFLFFYAVPALISVVFVLWLSPPVGRLLASGALLMVGVTVASMVLFQQACLEGSNPSLGVPVTLTTIGWGILLIWAWSARRTPEGGWTPASGFTISLVICMATSLGWYWPSLRAMSDVVGRNVNLPHWPFPVQLEAYTWVLLSTTWAAPAWLSIGLICGFAMRRLRWPTVMALAAVCTATVLAAYLARADERYILPAVGLVLFLCFAWAASTRIYPLVLLIVAGTSLLQVAWWLPGLQPFAAWVAVLPSDAVGRPRPTLVDAFQQVPGVRSPVTRAYPFQPILAEVEKRSLIRLVPVQRSPMTEVCNLLRTYAAIQHSAVDVAWPGDPIEADEQGLPAVVVPSDDPTEADATSKKLGKNYIRVGHWESEVMREAQGGLPRYYDLFVPVVNKIGPRRSGPPHGPAPNGPPPAGPPPDGPPPGGPPPGGPPPDGPPPDGPPPGGPPADGSAAR